MFEILNLLGATKKSIALETKLGNPIENEIAPEPSVRNIKKDEILYKNNANKWARRVQAIGRYNCFGLVWANRRTSIYSESARKLILADDGYREILLMGVPYPDDLIVYEDMDSNCVIHIGKVLMVKDSEIKILSKWDDSSGEYIHSPEDSPYRKVFPSLRTYYITERR